ncbi:hypothetical protein [Galbitalea soli]|uniref:Uncharacterized protein n=1 Tax=Galbitalea soli TaxID=1268042 RepID=A0A7C9PLX5_9MICO|nr:hypothetical protein [Galbitalea soli]NEM90505.1 hypothetical protein [Galbitalea soli]NYJ31218.1 hypothetical protein [Galbitalea soli]
MTSFMRPEENTLGVILGRRGKGSTPGVAKALRQASARGATLGTGYLGIGAGVLSGIEALYGLSLFIARWQQYPNPAPVIIAWLLYITAFVAALVTMSVLGDRLPHWLFALYLIAIGAVVALDFWGIWPLHDIGGYATASVSAGFGLMIVVTLRGGREVLAAAGLLGIAFLVAIALSTPLNETTIPTQIGTLALAVLPAALGVYVVRGFRRMVQLELDRVLVQSTVSAPRFAVGMLASEELARLDLAAEDLLESVAAGRTPLPLDPKTASVAASLATELRLHLIEGRRETWLYHAVSESEMLGKSVTLTDRGSLAGLLDPSQRDGLLSAVWLLMSDTTKPSTSRTVQITLGPMAAFSDRQPGNQITIPVVITTTDVPRNRVDPATWASIARVGRYSDSTQNSSLRVDIECFVDNPADQ